MTLVLPDDLDDLGADQPFKSRGYVKPLRNTARTESSGVERTVVRTAVQAGISPKPYGGAEATPVFLSAENSGRNQNSEAFYSFQPSDFLGFFSIVRPTPNYIRTILPGFIMPSGSSACLMLRMTSTAGPCSAKRKSILP